MPGGSLLIASSRRLIPTGVPGGRPFYCIKPEAGKSRHRARIREKGSPTGGSGSKALSRNEEDNASGRDMKVDVEEKTTEGI